VWCRSRSAMRWISALALAAVVTHAGVGDARAGRLAARSGPAPSRHFYVSPQGDDANAGSSPSLPWRTLAKVDAAALQPGDHVELQGGATFAEALAPYAGTAGTGRLPIVFESFGKGRARIRGGIYLSSVANLAFRDLEIASPPGKAVFSSAEGTGAQSIVLADMKISDAPLAGVSSNNRLDAGWRIDGVAISGTGDSGIYFVGSSFTITNSTITDTGRDARIPYPRHGIYAKGAGATIVGNAVRDFSTSGISLRRQGSLVEGNRISGGRKGISFDDEATAPGTTRVVCNSIRAVSDSGIAIMSAASERFVLADNTIDGAARNGVYAETVAELTLANNAVAARSLGSVLNTRSSIAGYSEHDNIWLAGRALRVYWNGLRRTFSTYSRISGQGRGDVLLRPGGAYRRRPAGSAACPVPRAAAETFRPPGPDTTRP